MDTQDPKYSAFNFDNSFARSLDDFFVSCPAAPSSEPKLLQLNYALAKELGLDPLMLDSEIGAAIFSGNVTPEGAEPLAQVYAGHQFGGFTPQLGDGRALLLGEVIDTRGQRRDIQLKGSGRTPFSRSGDGKAALGPILREYLIAEGMHALGVPTTRALAAISTGEVVYRENPLPGAILTRVASSHIRIGTFQFFAARGATDKVRELADYTIARHYPENAEAENPYLEFFSSVTEAQAALVAQWMNLGFIHGVMNTDNMAISGETIDYGPCAFMNTYSADTVFSSIDTHGRYAYGNQPLILSWNLARFAETLIPLVDPSKELAIEMLTEVVQGIEPLYETHWLAGMRSKIGLSTQDPGDPELINNLLTLMEEGNADFTLVFRRLSQVLSGKKAAARNLFDQPSEFDAWIQRWLKRLEKDGTEAEARRQSMDQTNPIYIPRNHKVEEALAAAVDHENMTFFSDLLRVLSHPFDEDAGDEAYATPGPVSAIPYQTFCGT
ncbi:MAG: YdiU family protein [Pseudomonadota bacterium]|nr:YdiU family protein [Pseudomonadota bacterium]